MELAGQRKGRRVRTIAPDERMALSISPSPCVAHFWEEVKARGPSLNARARIGCHHVHVSSLSRRHSRSICNLHSPRLRQTCGIVRPCLSRAQHPTARADRGAQLAAAKSSLVTVRPPAADDGMMWDVHSWSEEHAWSTAYRARVLTDDLLAAEHAVEEAATARLATALSAKRRPRPSRF